MKWGKKQRTVSQRGVVLTGTSRTAPPLPVAGYPSQVEPESLVGLLTIYRIPKTTRTTGGFLSDATTIRKERNFMKDHENNV